MRTERVLEALRQATRDCCSQAESVSLAFSGGLDSSVLAGLASDVTDVTLYTAGYPDSQDLLNALEASQSLGLSWVALHLDDELLMEAIRGLLVRFPGLDPLSLSFELPLWVTLQRCEDRVILAGQGADELFGGYARYEKLNGASLRGAMEKDLEKLIRETLPREDAMARFCGRELRLPYCHARVMEEVLPVEPELRRRPEGKALLRDVATLLGLPPKVVSRPKKAAQYGSGVTRHMKALAKRRGMKLGEFVRSVGEATRAS